MDNSGIDSNFGSMKNLSKSELVAIINQPDDNPIEKVNAAKSILSKREESYNYAKYQIEKEVDTAEILEHLKKEGLEESVAIDIIQEASKNADLNVAQQVEDNKKENSIPWWSIALTVFIVIRLIMRMAQ